MTIVQRSEASQRPEERAARSSGITARNISRATSGRVESLVDLLDESVRAHAARPLFVSKRDRHWVAMTYREFGAAVDALRSALWALGVGPGDRVGIIASNRVEWAVAAYASYGLGAAFVPMYESQHEKEWAFIVQDSGMKVLFVATREIHRKLEPLRASLPSLEQVIVLSGTEHPLNYTALLRRGEAAPVAAVRPAPADTAAVLYTSGTTGEPKGVVLSHGNITGNVLTMRELMTVPDENPADHRSLAFLPWAHAYGHTSELHASIAAGASIAIAESVETIVANLQEVKPTVLLAVPRLFLRIYNSTVQGIAGKPALIRWLFRRGLEIAKKRSSGALLGRGEALILRIADRVVFSRVRGRLGGRLKYACSGAAALSREVAEFVDALGIVVYEGYGLTETSPVVTANVPGQRKLGSVGRPIPGVRVVIDRSRTTDSEHGEIVVYGPNVMQGYYRRDADTRSVFGADGGFRTGDMGYLDDEGFLFITGRIKEQYKLANGKYVVPSPLEERIKVSPFIANAMIYGDNQPYNVALVVPDPAALRSFAEAAGLRGKSLEELVREPAVQRKIRDELDRLSTEFKGYERVKAFALVTEDFTQENGMLTPSLKLKRSNVLARHRERVDALYRDAAARDAAEKGADV